MTAVVLDSVFPGWSNPARIAGLVVGRFLLNCAVAGLVARVLRSPLAAVAGAAAVVSLALTVGVLRPGLLGIEASYLEAAVQLGVVGLALWVGLAADSRALTLAALLVAVLAVCLLAVSVPIYGEATVAP